MKELTADALIEGCADVSFDAGVSINTVLEPLAGPGAPVKPAVYEGGQYQLDQRWLAPAGSDGPTACEQVVVIDNVPSQANRAEAALLAFRERLGLPELVLDLSSIRHLPAHLPRRLSSFELPHRNADAYLRDAELGGRSFPTSETGRALFSASAADPAALFQWMPHALLYGFWQSHLGKKRQQTKLARSWTSEIVGVAPAAITTRTLGLKGDPLNLSIEDAVEMNPDDHTDWSLTDRKKASAKGDATAGAKKKDKLSEIGHGQVLVDGSLAPVSFREIVQQATVSFAGLRRIETGSAEANATGRALLVAIGMAGHVAAFGRSFSLRSGCELRPTRSAWVWRGALVDEPMTAPSFDAIADLVQACARAAQQAGLPVGSDWPAPLTLTPSKKLDGVIIKSWPLVDA
jgi:CRISPR-associated protein Csb1